MTYLDCYDIVSSQEKIIKPWGYEIIWANNQACNYVSKILFLESGKKISKQFHKVKDETIYILFGSLTLLIEKENIQNKFILNEGDSFHIPPGLIHRFVQKIVMSRFLKHQQHNLMM